ncbi:MAG: bifunctional metallophosphatase/5'-nucleotidase [Burkholderiaceae bacterium]|nr:bifunctional metallophosphatase/5'-nucleotidase [Burkholderiaceae bacterium]
MSFIRPKTLAASRIALAFLFPFLTVSLGACAPVPPTPRADLAPVKVTVLAINDFHGNLKPPEGGIRIQDPDHPGQALQVAAGGAEHLATAARQLMQQNPNHVFVAAGDLVGASPLLSALFHDEPTIDALSQMGLELSAVGNHEFDKGYAELLRQQYGGCHPVDGCQGPEPFKGARYHYLSASTWVEQTGKTLLPAYEIKRFEGVPVAFIGLTLKATPGIVLASGVKGLRFDDEADTINRLVPEIQAQGVHAIVVLIHEGGYPTGDYNECPGISGAIVDIAKKLDKAVDVVVSGHTHKAYNCRIDGRLVTSGDKYGTVLTDIELTLDRAQGTVLSAQARNLLVRDDVFAKDTDQTRLISHYERLAAPQIQRVVGHISDNFDATSAAGASSMGQLIADAQLAATRPSELGGAVIALTNPGGIRAPLLRKGDGAITYGQVFTSQPFSNNLVTLTLSGAQLLALLEQQWSGQAKFRPLQVSQGFSYSWDASQPEGHRVRPDSLRLQGQAIQPDARLRVTVNNYLADGGDGFSVLRQGSDRVVGIMDAEALARYLQSQALTTPSRLDRVTALTH